ncbi:hypothetical protein GGQ73_003054 [Rhizobium skierniewicense]|uniref:Uncharacterized protein n=1 Tax=Rhizobium skierniewicense TaxID=984260 RepID=A0A7W6G2S0_9HYPH|nr:hypothetical protein [Rhizobium skierniewicense]MBB3947090.1 hypothetical protein [Rhizobium skierniewicense]
MTDTTTGTAIPARPKYYDDAVREIAVDSIIDDVAEWIEESSQFQQKALKEVLVRCIDTNAYTFASNLERRYGWSPDARLVEILDQFSLYQAHEKVVAVWVSEHGVKIPFKVGDRICSPTIKAGTVEYLYDETAKIGIISDEDIEKTTRPIRLVDFEEATPILGTIGEASAPEGGAS